MHVRNNVFSIMDKVLHRGIVKYVVKNWDILQHLVIADIFVRPLALC